MLSKEFTDLPFHVGTRISSDGECGTIKFIGEIESQEGLWLGIEWDNPSRGKHSGSYKNKTYFHTSVPNAASFIRPWKASTGIPCPEAVRKKYGNAEELADAINLPQKRGRVKFIEMVGFEKVSGLQSQFHQLTEVVVSMMEVNSAGEPGELEQLVPNVISLDLSCNLFVSWSEVADITTQLHHLQSLVLSKNRLKVESNLENCKDAFVELKTLVLNDMSYTWSDVITCGEMWPYIEYLYLCKNTICALETPPGLVFSKLQFLNLDGNAIKTWSEIIKLGSISTLQELYLDDCQLQNINFPDVLPTEKTDLFPDLFLLSVCQNELSNWKDIAELNKLRKLKVLRITSNPILQTVNCETARQLVIAKISGLEMLNKTEVSKAERRGAEFDYIKRYYQEWIESGGHKDPSMSKPTQQCLEEHPTYLLLLQRHGAPEDSEISTQASLLKNNLLSIQIFSSLSPSNPPVIKRLPATMPICKVKGLIQRIFHVSAQDIKLTCLAANDGGKGMEMDNDLRQLSFYSLSDGDKIDVRW